MLNSYDLKWRAKGIYCTSSVSACTTHAKHRKSDTLCSSSYYTLYRSLAWWSTSSWCDTLSFIFTFFLARIAEPRKCSSFATTSLLHHIILLHEVIWCRINEKTRVSQILFPETNREREEKKYYAYSSTVSSWVKSLVLRKCLCRWRWTVFEFHLKDDVFLDEGKRERERERRSLSFLKWHPRLGNGFDYVRKRMTVLKRFRIMRRKCLRNNC